VLERLRGSIQGSVSPAMRLLARASAPTRLEELLSSALALWDMSDPWTSPEHTFNFGLFATMRRIQFENELQWLGVHVAYDAPQPDISHLSGSKSPQTSKRPDITLTFGSSFAMHIEAKKIDATATLSRKYVQEGMRRYIDGMYQHNPFGVMLGYCKSGTIATTLVAINDRVAEEPDLGADDELVPDPTGVAPANVCYMSEHRPACSIKHVHVEL
jgi:hypothetical protein